MAKKAKYNPAVDLTDAQEIACQALVGKAKGNKSEAYRIAYPGSEKWAESALNPKASRLFAKGKIEARVAQLQTALAKRNEISVDYVLKNFKEIGETCIKSKEHGNANRSFELIGKHLGMFIDRKHIALDAHCTIKVVERFGEED